LFQYFSSSGPRLFPLSVLGGEKCIHVMTQKAPDTLLIFISAAYRFTPFFFPSFFEIFTCGPGYMERLLTEHFPPSAHFSPPPMNTFLPAELDLEPMCGRSGDSFQALVKGLYAPDAKAAFFSSSKKAMPIV